MGGTRRSRTAQGVLAERAVLTDLGALDDGVARQMLTPSMAAVHGFVRRWPRRLQVRSVTLAGLAARVRWFDAQVEAALDAGIDQIVTVGAGYDARPWRFGREGVRFFELDHGATQQDKVRRAPAPGPTYVEADLRADDAADALAAHGLDGSRSALFVVEGVTMYLGEDVVRDQLGGLARSSAVASRLAIDFYPPRDAGTAGDRRQRGLQRLARAGSGEGFRLTVEPAAAVALVEASGWDVVDAVGLRAVARDLVPSSTGLAVESVNQHKSLVAAVRG